MWAKWFLPCAGRKQSPVDLDTSTAVTRHHPRIVWWNYSLKPRNMTVSNNGHTGKASAPRTAARASYLNENTVCRRLLVNNEVSLLTSCLYPSVCPRVSAVLPLEGFFVKRDPDLVKIGQLYRVFYTMS